MADNYSNRKITEPLKSAVKSSPCKNLQKARGTYIFLSLRYFLTAEWLSEFRSYQETGLAFLESLNARKHRSTQVRNINHIGLSQFTRMESVQSSLFYPHETLLYLAYDLAANT